LKRNEAKKYFTRGKKVEEKKALEKEHELFNENTKAEKTQQTKDTPFKKKDDDDDAKMI
jgi:hypothetical protein